MEREALEVQERLLSRVVMEDISKISAECGGLYEHNVYDGNGDDSI
jgi:hypothetical protein